MMMMKSGEKGGEKSGENSQDQKIAIFYIRGCVRLFVYPC